MEVAVLLRGGARLLELVLELVDALLEELVLGAVVVDVGLEAGRLGRLGVLRVRGRFGGRRGLGGAELRQR